MVSNTSGSPINGTFTGLPEGGTATATFGGNTFYFAISYIGGDGNDIILTRAAAPATNLITSGDATSHNGNGASGFLCTGTHSQSNTFADGFHLISNGSGDTKANKVEVDVPGMQALLMKLDFMRRIAAGEQNVTAED